MQRRSGAVRCDDTSKQRGKLANLCAAVEVRKWSALLLGFGLSERQLSGKHCPCPICGGNDRFRFDDKDGRVTFYCSHCGAGDGVSLVMSLKGCDFRTAAQEIEQAAGVIPAGEAPKQRSEADKVEKLLRVWADAKPLHAGDEAMRYLAGRGLVLDVVPDCLRLHPALPGSHITHVKPHGCLRAAAAISPLQSA